MKLKSKNIFVLGSAVFLSLFMSQQVVAQTNGRAGIKGGLNISNLYLDNVNDQNARLGFHAGVYGQILSSETFAIQPELLFSTKGAKANYSGLIINQDVSYNLNYIDLPVLLVFKLGETVEIHAGAYASYLLSANISYEGNAANGVKEVNKNSLKSFDYGLAGGLGMNFGNVQVGARYNYGLVKIADSDAARTLLGDAKNSCAQLFVALNLGKK